MVHVFDYLIYHRFQSKVLYICTLHYLKIDTKLYLYLDYLDTIKIDDINDFLCLWYFCVKVKSNYSSSYAAGVLPYNKITLCLSCNGQRNWWLLSACVALHTWQTLTAALCPSVDETWDSVWGRTARLTTWTGNPQPPQPSICIVWRNPNS